MGLWVKLKHIIVEVVQLITEVRKVAKATNAALGSFGACLSAWTAVHWGWVGKMCLLQ